MATRTTAVETKSFLMVMTPLGEIDEVIRSSRVTAYWDNESQVNYNEELDTHP
jgi:hypothetical protein